MPGNDSVRGLFKWFLMCRRVAGTQGLYFHNEDTHRTTPGQAVTAIVSATIDAATRTFSRLVSRDSR